MTVVDDGQLVLPLGIALEIEEKQIQGEFAAHRVRGEWFAPTPDLLYLVDRLGGDFIDWERTQ